MTNSVIKHNKDSRTAALQVFFCCVLAAVPLLLLCSKCSWLYPFNDWPDVNIFFTLGKGMVKGELPYVDLMDQKGPYVYLAGAAAYLLSHTTFYGYFVLEIISVSVFLYYSCQIIRLYTDFPAAWVLPLLAASVVSAKSFVHGGSLEELCLGIFACAIYSMLRFLHGGEECMSRRTIALNGILAGILLWSKFTLLGLYLVWVLVVAAVYLRRKKLAELFRAGAIFLGAMILTTVPWLLYFGYHHAVGAWFQTYLWDNIFTYAEKGNGSLIQKIFAAAETALRFLYERGNRTFSIPAVLGGAVFLCLPGKRVSFREKVTAALLGAGMALGIFIGGTKHDYYGLPLCVFGVFGALALVMLAELVWKRLFRKVCTAKQWQKAAVFVLTLALGCAGAYRLSPNVYLLSVDKKEMPQYQFAEIINQSEDRSLLNYGFLDGGFYTVLDEVPTTKYYYVMNMNPAWILEQQNKVLEREEVNWVVTWKAYPVPEEELQKLPVITEHYTLEACRYFYFEGDLRTYALYRHSDRTE